MFCLGMVLMGRVFLIYEKLVFFFWGDKGFFVSDKELYCYGFLFSS